MILMFQAACGGSYNQNLTYWSTTSTTPCTINICKCQEEVGLSTVKELENCQKSCLLLFSLYSSSTIWSHAPCAQLRLIVRHFRSQHNWESESCPKIKTRRLKTKGHSNRKYSLDFCERVQPHHITILFQVCFLRLDFATMQLKGLEKTYFPNTFLMRKQVK